MWKILYVRLNCAHIVMFNLVIHACYRRPKALKSLCLLLYIVMLSLKKILILSYKQNGITNAKFLQTDHGYFNRPSEYQSTTYNRLKPVMTTGLVNTHTDLSIAYPMIAESGQKITPANAYQQYPTLIIVQYVK